MSMSRSKRGDMSVALAIVLMVVVAGVAFAAGYLLRPDDEPEARPVAEEFGALLAQSHPVLEQADDAREVAALYAENALAMDAPSGMVVQGRDGITGGWQYMFAQGGSFTVDHVLADDRWAALGLTWTATDAEGEELSAPMVLLLEIEDGRIVSELDIYDAASTGL